MSEFKVGDIVRRKEEDRDIYWCRVARKNADDMYEVIQIRSDGWIKLKDAENSGGWNPYFFNIVDEQSNLMPSIIIRPMTSLDKMKTQDTIEELKSFNKKNLLAGKGQAKEDAANYEAAQAKAAYVLLIDNKETQERIIKVAEEELKKINESLKIFN